MNVKLHVFSKFGEPRGIRTPDPRLRRALLYPAELLTQINLTVI